MRPFRRKTKTFNIFSLSIPAVLTHFEQLQEFVFDKLRKELPAHLSYHNIDHTLDVMQAADFLAMTEGFTEYDRALLKTAALLHDTGFLLQREEHEASSCALAREYLAQYGYTTDEIETICNLIMATRLPQSPKDKLAEVLCDADLDYLGRADFLPLSDKLFAELQSEGLVKDPDEWNRQQTDFMSAHRYFTQTAINLRQPRKTAYIEMIKQKISA